MRPHILFVINDILGWSTYGAQLQAAAVGRSDLRHTILRRRLPRVLSGLLRRHAGTGSLARLRLLDPITAHRGVFGRDIRAAVRDLRPDLVHVAAHWPAAAVLRAAPDMRVTAALDATRASVMRDFATADWSAAEIAAERDLINRLAHVFPMSRWTADSIATDYGVDRARISILPPSLSPDSWPAPARHAPRDGPVRILFVGNDLDRKGAQRLVDWVRGPLAGRAQLHIVSGDSRSLPDGDGVIFHGRVPHDRLVAEILPEMDIFCLPTRLDMSPHVLIEAAAAGLPAVASRLGGIPDLVLDGRTGHLAEPGDDAGFVAALSALIDDRDARLRMGEAARDLARASFDGARNFNRLFDTLVDLAAGQRTPS